MTNAWEERRQRKIERYRQRAANAQGRSADARAKADRTYDLIPLGQPMLVDHYSYKADRNRRERAEKNMHRSFEEADKASEWERRADAVESDTSISRNDPDAIDKLNEKIASLEAQQERRKEINATLRRNPAALYLSPREASDFLSVLHAFHRYNARTFKGYDLANLNANIRRYRQRLDELTQREATAATTGYARSMPNRWPGECVKCGAHVEAREGMAAQPARGPWEVLCGGCWQT